METQDAIWYVIMVALLYPFTLGTTTDIAGWIAFLAVILVFIAVLIIALQQIPAVPDLVPEDISKLLVWAGVSIVLLLVLVNVIQLKFSLSII